jgi:hypothetical protein
MAKTAALLESPMNSTPSGPNVSALIDFISGVPSIKPLVEFVGRLINATATRKAMAATHTIITFFIHHAFNCVEMNI